MQQNSGLFIVVTFTNIYRFRENKQRILTYIVIHFNDEVHSPHRQNTIYTVTDRQTDREIQLKPSEKRRLKLPVTMP